MGLGALSSNPNITWTVVNNNPDKPWRWYWLSRNPNITWDIVGNNPDKPWSRYTLSQNPNITMDIVLQNPDKGWYWNEISKNPNITWAVVKNNIDKPWNWRCLSENTFNYQKVPKLPEVYPQQKALILDLEQNWFGIPPNVNKKPVFIKGGPWYHDEYEEYFQLKN